MPTTKSDDRTEFALSLHRLGALQFGEFTLKDGSSSPVYCDLRLLISDPATLRQAARYYARLLRDIECDRIAGIPYAGLPIATAVAVEIGLPLIFPRREVKEYGTQRAIEGRFEAGERVALIDDLVSSGKSKFEAIEPLEAAGLVVKDVVVLVDRRPAGSRDLEDAGYRVHTAFTLVELARMLAASGQIGEGERHAVERFLAG